MVAVRSAENSVGAMPTEAAPAVGTPTVRVWDPFVRIFHWMLLGLFVAAFVSAEESETLHVWIGYSIALLLILRVAWGFVGSRHARFSDFVRSPRATGVYLVQVLRSKAPRHLGHNPAGGIMVVALLLAVSGIAATGIMMTTDAFWGSEALEDIHEALVYGTIGLICLHVAGVILSSIQHRENLVRAMFTGRKRPL